MFARWSRLLLLLGPTLPLACSFPTEILVPTSPEAGTGEDASTTCAPVTPPAWSAAWVPPAGAGQDACATQDLSNLYAACFGPEATTDACASMQTANPTCAGCVLSASTDSSWGPVVAFAATTIVNQPGCLALEAPSEQACAQSAEAQFECEHAACDPGCPVSDGPSYEAWEACVEEADQGVCGDYGGTCLADALEPDGGDGGASSCDGTDFGTAFMNVAAVFCGP
jgi:hypothetical protein